MPNYIHINLSVMGKDQRLKEFTQQAKGKRKPTGDTPTFPEGRININYDGATNPPSSVFEFDRLIPLPESYSRFPYSDHGYYLEMSIWGVKWGAFGHEPPKFEEGSATYQFTCAWEAPRIFLEKVSRNWPDLWFVISYGGEGPTRGKFALHNGNYLENVEDNGYSYDEEIPEDEEEKQYEAWVRYYQNAHETYTKYILVTYIVQSIYSSEE